MTKKTLHHDIPFILLVACGVSCGSEQDRPTDGRGAQPPDGATGGSTGNDTTSGQAGTGIAGTGSGGRSGAAGSGGSGGDNEVIATGGSGGNPASGAGAGAGQAGQGGEAGALGEPDFAGLILSEYLEGTGFDKAVEVSNLSEGHIDTSSCNIELYINGALEPRYRIALGPVLGPQTTHVICHSSISSGLAPFCDQLTGSLSFNGDDAMALTCDGLALDHFGQIGVDPGTSWGAGATVDHVLRRKCGVVDGDPLGTVAFEPSEQWEAFALSETMGFGNTLCAP